jgi:hypothetical protein
VTLDATYLALVENVRLGYMRATLDLQPLHAEQLLAVTAEESERVQFQLTPAGEEAVEGMIG